MKTVSFVIELKDKFSEIIKKNIEFAGKLSEEMKVVQSQTKKYQDLCSRLEMPNLNAMIQVAERAGGVLGTMTDKGMSFGQSMADLSAITGIVGDIMVFPWEKEKPANKPATSGRKTSTEELMR